ncbi:phosphate/phosphite/phosphonate ABC transporter substrate-binding protein [Pseudalkalibacillus salsuginis]|uniref:phosphate/phosphite/phosphonate ABC transporter substrate-binding protein n=1 Tax=Pseudalkalibacillus salsuginis TaxID=2910972 RepID=UPI001F2E1737|nr:phosphate/phosphite/phosphonate ABC transporter substrate-binding protein [Pseudalkalibacillus salsuginis]MCF6411134.1 phosphate/phosphite/phosphonate ABC transporter substrate-binding protein [Pseudalkalibacillus salsuginis]
MKKVVALLFAAILAIGTTACGTSSDSDSSGGNKDGEVKKIVMGFVPSQDSDEIADTVEPLADKLGEELGVEVEGKVMTSYSALVEAMGSNQVQIGFLPAFGYVLANEKHGVEVILKSERFGSGTYKAQYVVRADSGIESLEDMEGKAWAIPDLTSTSGFLFPAAQIMDKFGVEDVQSGFFSNTVEAGGHDNAIISVYEGDADVATTFDDARTAVEEDYPDVMDKLKVVEYTDEIPNDTISVTKELSDEWEKKIKDTFLSFNDDEEMIKIMNEVYSWDAIIEAEDSEYDVVRDTYEKFKDSISID